MIIKLKRFSYPSPPSPLKTPKPKILGEKSAVVTSKNGVKFRRRLDENSNLNFGRELRKLEDEKRQLGNLKMEDI